MVGGKIKTGETSEQAVIREYKEELDIDISIDRLLWIAENFFEFNGVKYHEFNFTYLINMGQDVNKIDTAEKIIPMKMFNLNGLN